METDVVDLSALKIPIPSDADLQGVPTAWYHRDIMSILKDQDPCEIACLKTWITENVLEHIGWSDTIEISIATVNSAIELFEKLGLKPKGCTYEPTN